MSNLVRGLRVPFSLRIYLGYHVLISAVYMTTCRLADAPDEAPKKDIDKGIHGRRKDNDFFLPLHKVGGSERETETSSVGKANFQAFLI